MKKKFLGTWVMLLAFMCACDNKDVVYEIPGADKYTHVYLLQAVNVPNSASLFMIEGTQTLDYSAFYSGLTAPKDIHVRFSVDPTLVDEYNEINQTSYEAMPEGSYELETSESVIPAGESRTPLLKISIHTFGHIEAFKSYLLPLVVETSDATLNQELSVAYYQIVGSYAPGQIPRRLLNDNVPNAIEMFSYRDKSLVTRSEDGVVRSYPYDADSQTFGAPKTVANDWIYGFVPHLAAVGGDSPKFLMTDGAWLIWVVTWDEDGSTPLPEPSNFTALNRWLFTGGANIFDRLIYTSRTDGLFGRWGSDGSISYYQFNSDWTAYTGVAFRNFVNWSNQRIIFVYKGDFITIDEVGDMWLYKYSAGDYRINSPTKVGSGWDMYTHVTPFGDHIVARDADGNLWEYEFDLRGFWALK